MAIVKGIICFLFIVISLFLTVVILMQEGKHNGLGSIGGGSDSYWKKNRGRSMEGALVKITKYLAIAFIVLAVILNFGF